MVNTLRSSIFAGIFIGEEQRKELEKALGIYDGDDDDEPQLPSGENEEKTEIIDTPSKENEENSFENQN